MNLFAFPSFGARRLRALVTAGEVVLVIILAVQAARLAWIVLAPVGPIGHAPVPAGSGGAGADLAILARFDPFFRLAGAAPVPRTAATSDDGLRLSGVRADGEGGGSAIIRTTDGREASYLVGEEVEPGLVLRAVHGDHVILSRGGARQRVSFPRTPAANVAAPAAALAGPVLGPADPAAGGREGVGADQFLAAAALAPRVKDGRTQGYRVMPRGGSGADVLGRAGLQPGDVILSIDGSEFNAERVGELSEELAKAEAVDLRIERGGQILNTRVRISSR